MSLAVQILAALDTLAREERERAELGGRLMAEVQEAADELQAALVPILGHVTVCTSVPRSASVLGGYAVMDGEALVSGADVHLRIRGSTLIVLRWRHGPNAARCWATTDATGDRYPTALDALRAGLERSETARQMAEVVGRLRGQGAAASCIPVDGVGHGWVREP